MRSPPFLRRCYAGNAPAKARDVTLGIKRRSLAPRPRNISTTVLNGNGVAGSAANAAYVLGQGGVIPVVGGAAVHIADGLVDNEHGERHAMGRRFGRGLFDTVFDPPTRMLKGVDDTVGDVVRSLLRSLANAPSLVSPKVTFSSARKLMSKSMIRIVGSV